MKRISFCILLAIIINICLWAGETEDLLFCVGLYEDGDYYLAQKQLETFIEKYPASPYLQEMRSLLADALLENKEYEQAEPLYEDLVKQPAVESEYSRLLLGLAQSLYYQGKFLSASSKLKSLREKYPNQAEVAKINYLLGSCLFETRNLVEAEKYLNISLEQEESLATRVKLIQVLLAGDALEKAWQIFNSGRELYTQEDDLQFALLLLQTASINARDYKNLTAANAAVIPADSPYGSSYDLLSGIAYFEQKDYDSAIRVLENHSQEKARYYYALALLEKGDEQQSREIFTSLVSAEDMEIKSNSTFYLADLQQDEQEKLRNLKNFIDTYPKSIFIAEAYYKYGVELFARQDYEAALFALQEAINQDLNENYRAKAQYLRAESHFQLNNIEMALNFFDDYITAFPRGELAPEAYFKKGVCLYESGKQTEALVQFDLVIYNYPDSDKLGLSNFYKAEIALLDNDYEEARKHYTIALNQNVDKDLIWLRIARSWQQDGNLAKAAAALDNVHDDSGYALSKTILLADLAFNQKDYERAAAEYKKAVSKAEDPDRREKIQAKLAWTYYQMDDYEKASSIYEQLSIRTDNPAEYTFQSATALFSARQYEKALKQYKVYVENFPASSSSVAARTGIADCYYNLGNYAEARRHYRQLLLSVSDPELYGSILDGWKWSTEQDGKDFLAEIDDLLKGSIQENYRFLILEYKAKYLYLKGHYSETLELIDKMKHEFMYPMRELEYLKARSLKQEGLWDLADDFYARLFMVYKDPLLQLEWAEITLAQNKIDTTIKKLQYASERMEDTRAILRLLQVEAQYKRPEFKQDYDKYLPRLSGMNLQKAKLEYAFWLIDKGDYSSAAPLIAELKTGNSDNIKAEAQYLQGYSYYKQEKFEQAVPEFLRVRHLFPHLLEVRQRAEILAFKSYLKTGKTAQAQNLLDNIGPELDEKKLQELESLLKGE